MVDAVITWVDGEEPAHKAKREKYFAKEEKSDCIAADNNATRWADNNEVWYCINLIRINAPWIERIYLVTDAQIPVSLDERERERLGVFIVDHETIFEGMGEFLPTFNSISIETVLHRIPELSEQFLYFNDDVFAISETKYEDYFSKRGLKPRGQLYWIKTRLGRIAKNLTPRLPHGFNDYRGGLENRATRHRVFRSAHAPHPLSRSMLYKFLGSDFVWANARYRFRHRNQLQPLDILFNQGIRHDFVKPGGGDWGYIKPTECGQEGTARVLEDVLTNRNIKTICVQSLDESSLTERSSVYEWLNYLISNK